MEELIDVKQHFKLSDISKVSHECISIKMKGDWNDADYVYETAILPLNEETLESLYLLEVSKDKDTIEIKDYSGEIFDFINSYFISDIPFGYDTSIHTLTYDLIYHDDKGNEYNMELLIDRVPKKIRERIDNILEVYRIYGKYYYNNDLVNILLEIYKDNKISRSNIEKLIDSYDCMESGLLAEIISNESQLPREELIEYIDRQLINIYGY